MRPALSRLGLILAMSLVASTVFAQSIANWPAPAFWSPQKASGTLHGLTTQDLTNPLPFIPITPCRIVNTTNGTFPAGYGPPSLSQGAPRDFTLTGQCGIPASAGAVSLNVAVTNTQGSGFIKIFPAGGPTPPVSTLNYIGVLPLGQAIANAAIVPLSAGGAITVIAGVSGTDLIIDTNGYYYDSKGGTQPPVNGDEVFAIVKTANTSDSPAIFAWNKGSQTDNFGIEAWTSSTGDGSAGLQGLALGANGAISGVYGQTNSADIGAAGVLGVDGTPILSAKTLGISSAGVLGLSTNTGVQGGSTTLGVSGLLFPVSGTVSIAEGDLGISFGDADPGNCVGPCSGPPWGVFSFGNLGASGVKNFVEPHPTDPTRVILYASLEGPEVGTYLRGTARTEGGRAVISLPDHFRMVTDEEGMTVQLTPVGDFASMYVESEDLTQIVVRSSKDVTFHYLVQGVRRAFKGFEPVERGLEFMPRSSNQEMPAYLTPEAKRRLIANGTYNSDGSVNMETASRLGWTRIWAERETAAREAAAKAAEERSKQHPVPATPQTERP
jgi:hypothetical protein